jgi:thiol-disulfide isomerase/thioredoxin
MNQRDIPFGRWLALIGGILLSLAAVMEYWPTSSTLQWLDIDQAKALGASQRKPVLVDVYAEWCGPCKNMDNTVFPDDSVQRVLKSRYVLAKIDGDDPVLGDSLRKQLHIRAYPTYIVLTPTGRERKRHVGALPKDQFVQWLNDPTGIGILQWLEFDNAVQQASAQKRRVMVLVLNSAEEIESANALFEDPKVGEIVGKRFVPTLLVGSNSLNRLVLDKLRFGFTEDALGEVIVLEGGRKEVGRFRIDGSMEFSSSDLAKRLQELSAK